MAEPDRYDAQLSFLLQDRRRRGLEMMAAFCKYWGLSPAEYKALTVEELDVMTKYANDDIERRNKAAKQQQARRRR